MDFKLIKQMLEERERESGIIQTDEDLNALKELNTSCRQHEVLMVASGLSPGPDPQMARAIMEVLGPEIDKISTCEDLGLVNYSSEKKPYSP
jgi:hypothetical protein